MELKETDGLSTAHYAAIAAFRYELRRFLSFSERAAASAGLPAQQHQALLAVAGYRGPGRPTVGYLVDQLLVAPHTAAELVARMVETGLLLKAASKQDRRRMELELTPKAEDLLRVLTPAHLEELRNLEPALAGALGKLSRARPGPNQGG